VDLAEQIRQAVAMHLPGREVKAIHDRGAWVRQIVDVTLDGDEDVLFKISLPQPGWLEGGEAIERDVAQILKPHELAVIPEVMAVDSTCAILPHPFVIQEKVGGTRLGSALRQAPDEGAAIYEAVGCLYAQIHAIQGPCDGLWNGSTPDAPWGDPTPYMFQAEIVEGSGKGALEAGRISRSSYERAVQLWRANLDYLKAHTPSLVHISAFPWTIYLERDAAGWRIVKLTSVGDFLWWDAAFDAACLRYPPFGEMQPAWWAGFLAGYGREPERKRLLLYAVMQRLSAVMGCYMEPEAEGNAAWREGAFKDLTSMLDELEALS
jgi:hypothetical protein